MFKEGLLYDIRNLLLQSLPITKNKTTLCKSLRINFANHVFANRLWIVSIQDELYVVEKASLRNTGARMVEHGPAASLHSEKLIS